MNVAVKKFLFVSTVLNSTVTVKKKTWKLATLLPI